QLTQSNAQAQTQTGQLFSAHSFVLPANTISLDAPRGGASGNANLPGILETSTSLDSVDLNSPMAAPRTHAHTALAQLQQSHLHSQQQRQQQPLSVNAARERGAFSLLPASPTAQAAAQQAKLDSLVVPASPLVKSTNNSNLPSPQSASTSQHLL